ncbi:MAG: hypothetical protein K8S27_07260 [Candidatus Omnitrophica bacterium]|nr:hypothetical protein [Candidatus Omnitrophota bacterium]
MNYFSLSGFFIAATSLLIGVFVLIRNPRAAINRALFYNGFSLFFWALNYAFWQMSSDAQQALFLNRVTMIGAIFIPSTFLHFCFHLLNSYHKNVRKIVVCYCFSIIFILLDMTPLFVQDVRPRLIFSFWPTAGVAFTSFLVYFFSVIFWGLCLLYSHSMKVTGNNRKQLRLVFWSILISLTGGAFNFPLWYDIPIIPYPNILVVFYVFALSYAIFRYRLIDVQLVIKKSLVYMTMIAVLTALYAGFVYFFEVFFRELIGYKSIFVSLIYALSIAVIFIPLRNWLQRFINRVFFRGSFLDLFEQNKQLKQEIAKTDKYRSLTTLTKGIVLEMKNPLSSLQGYAFFLPKRMDDEKFLTRFAAVLHKDLNRLTGMIDKLNDYCQPTSIALKDVDIKGLLLEAFNAYKGQLTDLNIDLQLDISDEDIYLNVDPNQIRQVFVNIGLNAIESMPEGGVLTVGLKRSRDFVLISIQDSGYGIPPEDLSQIFDPFYSLKDQNTGLGLSITQGIIENHQGKIRVTSKIGEGSEFVIELPL